MEGRNHTHTHPAETINQMDLIKLTILEYLMYTILCPGKPCQACLQGQLRSGQLHLEENPRKTGAQFGDLVWQEGQ